MNMWISIVLNMVFGRWYFVIVLLGIGYIWVIVFELLFCFKFIKEVVLIDMRDNFYYL